MISGSPAERRASFAPAVFSLRLFVYLLHNSRLWDFLWRSAMSSVKMGSLVATRFVRRLRITASSANIVKNNVSVLTLLFVAAFYLSQPSFLLE